MYKQQVCGSKVLRFRRWSRRGYALFISVLNVVTIGVLAISIGNKSVHKSNTVQSDFVVSESVEKSEYETDLVEVKDLNQDLYTNIVVTSNESLASADCAST